MGRDAECLSGGSGHTVGLTVVGCTLEELGELIGSWESQSSTVAYENFSIVDSNTITIRMVPSSTYSRFKLVSWSCR